MGLALDLVGQRFGRLLVLERVGASGGKYVLWRCRCDCGNLVEISTRDLRSRGTVSCGCSRREKAAQNLGGDPHQKLGQVEGTNLSRIKSEKIQKKQSERVHRGQLAQKQEWRRPMAGGYLRPREAPSFGAV